MVISSMRVLCVVPARRDSRRCVDKNFRKFSDKGSLTDIAVRFSGRNGRDVVVVARDYCPPIAGVRVKTYPQCGAYNFRRGTYQDEIDNTVQIWRYALYGDQAPLLYGEYGLTALIEPSCYPRVEAEFREAIEGFDGRTTISVKLAHRYGLKAHVFIPTGAFYLAKPQSVIDGSVFDGDLRYMVSGSPSVNIDTEDDFVRAQEL